MNGINYLTELNYKFLWYQQVGWFLFLKRDKGYLKGDPITWFSVCPYARHFFSGAGKAFKFILNTELSSRQSTQKSRPFMSFRKILNLSPSPSTSRGPNILKKANLKNIG